MTIQAKPTTIRGIHFRSRLEARWAVFFDELGLEWEYEPQPITDDYQPDFALKGWGHIEVKPLAWFDRPIPADDPDVVRWKWHVQLSGRMLHAVFGPPGQWKNGVLQEPFVRCLTLIPGEDRVVQTEFIECPGCHSVGFTTIAGRLIGCGCSPRRLTRAAEAVRNYPFDNPPGWAAQ